MTNNREDLELALIEAALEEKLGGAAPPDLAAAVLAATSGNEPPAARAAGGWRWLSVAAAMLVCGAALGWWWRAHGPGEGSGEAPKDATSREAQAKPDASDDFYRPRDVADARRLLELTDAPDVQFHFVGRHRLPTDSVMGPPAPTLALGRWGLGKALALAMRKALDDARPADGFDAAARAHTIFVGAGNHKRMRLAVAADVLWVDGLGAFTANLGDMFKKRLLETELETRHTLGLIHRQELEAGLPNELIPAEQAVLRPFELGAEDVSKLVGLTKLTTLDLRFSEAGHTQAVLQQVATLTSVRELRVRTLTDATLSIVAGMRLERLLALGSAEAPWRSSLLVNGNDVTDVAIGPLLQLTDLQTLVLPGCRLSRPGVARLAGLANLSTLVLSGLAAPGDSASVWDAFAGHTRLTELRISGWMLVWDRDLAELARLPALEELALDGCWPLNAQQNADRLHLADLRNCPKLRRLSLGRWFPAESRPMDDATQRALVSVASTPSLRWLSLSDCPGLRAEDLLALREAKQLDTLDLSGTAGDAPGLIPAKAIEPLLDAIPGLTIVTN